MQTRAWSSEEELNDIYRAAQNQERDVYDLIQRTYDSHEDVLLREQERSWLAETIAQAEQTIAARRAQLNSNDQRDFDLRREITEAQLKLDALAREQVALLSQDVEVEEIECAPTPIAKAFHGKEIHVLLANDFVAVLPADELIEQMYADFEQNVWRLKQEDEMVRTIGPLNGFRLQYSFAVTDFVAHGRNGLTATGKKPEFLGLYFLPVTNPVGESAEQAMQSGSKFRQQLQQVDPSRTAITVWTYPGNYERLRELRRYLRELGFQTAIRPLPKGCPIGFSPNGTRSVTE